MRLLKILVGFCLVVFVLSLLFFTIQCLFSAWWNILLILIFLLTWYWCTKRSKREESIWQGILVIIIALLLLVWFLIPCVIGHYEDLEEEPKMATESESDPLLIADKNKVKDEDDEEKKRQAEHAEKERAEQVESERAEQVDREKVEQAEKERAEQVERERAEQVERERAEQVEKEKAQLACSNIRGNISSSGEKIFHMPSGQFYNKTVPEETFCTKSEARSAGYRESKL